MGNIDQLEKNLYFDHVFNHQCIAIFLRKKKWEISHCTFIFNSFVDLRNSIGFNQKPRKIFSKRKIVGVDFNLPNTWTPNFNKIFGNILCANLYNRWIRKWVCLIWTLPKWRKVWFYFLCSHYNIYNFIDLCSLAFQI